MTNSHQLSESHWHAACALASQITSDLIGSDCLIQTSRQLTLAVVCDCFWRLPETLAYLFQLLFWIRSPDLFLRPMHFIVYMTIGHSEVNNVNSIWLSMPFGQKSGPRNSLSLSLWFSVAADGSRKVPSWSISQNVHRMLSAEFYPAAPVPPSPGRHMMLSGREACWQ